MLRGLIVLAALMLTAAPAHAQMEKCFKSAVSTAEMRACQQLGLAEVDARLNAAYRRAMAALAPDRQEKLRRSERAWITFRDLDCDVHVGADTGTLATIEVGSCLIDRREQRIRDLAEFVD